MLRKCNLCPVPTFAIRSTDIHYTESGKGSPVLFLHGVPDTQYIWEGVIERLSADFQCIAPDWPGFGGSGKAVNFDFSLDDHAEIVREMADELGLREPFLLVSHDFGGISAMAFAAKYPSRLSHLVVSNAPFSPDYRWHPWARIWRTPGLGELSSLLMNPLLFKLSLRRGSRLLSDKHLNQTYRNIDWKMKMTILKLYRAMDPEGWQEWLPRLQAATKLVPTLVLWGKHDPYIPDWMPEKFAAQRVKRFEKSGHWLPAEMPESFAAEISQFCQSD